MTGDLRAALQARVDEWEVVAAGLEAVGERVAASQVESCRGEIADLIPDAPEADWRAHAVTLIGRWRAEAAEFRRMAQAISPPADIRASVEAQVLRGRAGQLTECAEELANLGTTTEAPGLQHEPRAGTLRDLAGIHRTDELAFDYPMTGVCSADGRPIVRVFPGTPWEHVGKLPAGDALIAFGEWVLNGSPPHVYEQESGEDRCAACGLSLEDSAGDHTGGGS